MQARTWRLHGWKGKVCAEFVVPLVSKDDAGAPAQKGRSKEEARSEAKDLAARKPIADALRDLAGHVEKDHNIDVSEATHVRFKLKDLGDIVEDRLKAATQQLQQCQDELMRVPIKASGGARFEAFRPCTPSSWARTGWLGATAC